MLEIGVYTIVSAGFHPVAHAGQFAVPLEILRQKSVGVGQYECDVRLGVHLFLVRRGPAAETLIVRLAAENLAAGAVGDAIRIGVGGMGVTDAAPAQVVDRRLLIVAGQLGGELRPVPQLQQPADIVRVEDQEHQGGKCHGDTHGPTGKCVQAAQHQGPA